MVDVITLVVVSAGMVYGIVHLGLTLGLRRNRFSGGKEKPFVSVIVAARNEERSLPPLLRVLGEQSYPNCEIIVVNDRSTDGTRSVVEAAQRIYPNIRCVDSALNSDDMPAKKNALRTGILQSRGEILCFTDADCLPQHQWIETLVAAFDTKTGMVAGYSPYRQPRSSVLFRFIAYEEFRGAIWAGGSIGWRKAWLCTGRNLAYRRKVFEEVGGFESIKMSVSGDDDLLMQAVRRQTKWNIRYCYDERNAVLTDPPETFSAFFNQRKRHFSAGKFFPFSQKMFFSAYHGSNLLLVVSFALLFSSDTVNVGIFGLVAKLLADSMLVFSGYFVLKPAIQIESYLFMELLYMWYNTLIGPFGFIGDFKWKESL
jgi:cellulose synthase/poly-beta-1,6-N-acetylglucosamine synthase-like glycosyltransferase